MTMQAMSTIHARMILLKEDPKDNNQSKTTSANNGKTSKRQDEMEVLHR